MKPSQDIYDPEYVKDVFDKCSDTYIRFSYLCSMGFTERWRKQCVAALPVSSIPLKQGYDLMAGTGEVWPHLLKRLPNVETITAIDISAGMHKRAIDRIGTFTSQKIDFIEDNLFESALEDASADFVVSTFGLKTFNPAQHSELAALIARILKPGGSFSLIEASDPKGWMLRPLYLFHLKRILPAIEYLFLAGAQDFSLIGKYSTNFGNAKNFADMLRSNGLEVEYKTYFFGCATGVCGRKPI